MNDHYRRNLVRDHFASGKLANLFEAAKDAGRPFLVTAYYRRFVAVDAAFDVRLDGAQINVTTIEGTVRVERTTNIESGGPASVAMRSLSATPKSANERTEQDLAGRPLPGGTTRTAGEQLDREIKLIDAARADLRLSGGFSSGRLRCSSKRLRDYIPIQFAPNDDHAIILRARE